MSFVDITVRPPAPTELRRFAQRLGPRTLLDSESAAFKAAGLGYLSMDDTEVMERVVADPRLLRLPLVRAGDRFVVGPDEAGWKALLG